MTVRPILFSGPEVRALLDGRKTQTRRVIKARIGRRNYLPEFCGVVPCCEIPGHGCNVDQIGDGE